MWKYVLPDKDTSKFDNGPDFEGHKLEDLHECSLCGPFKVSSGHHEAHSPSLVPVL